MPKFTIISMGKEIIELKVRLKKFSESDLERLTTLLNISFGEEFSKEEKISLLLDQGQNRLRIAMKKINPNIFKY